MSAGLPRVLVAADSLAMPRDGVAYDSTWVHRLKTRLREFEIIDKSERGLSTEQLRGEDLLESYEPDISITQVGIVDCSPRYSNKYERKAFKLIPNQVTEPYMHLMKSIRTRHPKRAYVSPTRFEANLHNYYGRAKQSQTDVVSICIAPPWERFVEKSPYIVEQVNQYNDIIKHCAEGVENVTVLNPYTDIADPESVFCDAVHVNKNGHAMIADRICDFFHGWIPPA